MHIETTLLSLPVAATAWALSGGAAPALKAGSPSARPGAAKFAALSALVFAAQMVNVAIPGTGSSGHFVGAFFLALALGPWYGLLAMASVLGVQSLFFHDGGLLAYGANVLNMGVIPAALAGLLMKRGLPEKGAARPALIAAGAAFSLAMGAVSVSVLGALSGHAGIGFTALLGRMLPIHAVIGLGEGAITVLLLQALRQRDADPAGAPAWGPALALTAVCALALSSLPSADPDGLNWALQGVRLQAAPSADGLVALTERLQDASAVLRGVAAPLAGLLGSLLTASLAWTLHRAVTKA